MNRRAALCASMVGDALSLGPHWIYNQSKIARLHPDGVREYSPPASEYHPNRRAGRFSHYGDQAVALLRSLAFRGGWSEDGFRSDWRAMWPGYDGYVDGATKETLAHLESGSTLPSQSDDLAGASRMAPLVVALRADPLEGKIAAARAQTAITHGDAGVIDAAEFFVRATELVLDGKEVREALAGAAAAPYASLPAMEWLARAGHAAASDNTAGAAAELGLTCHLKEAFPATLMFIMKFAADPAAAFSANALAGGDTCARAMLIGLVLGAAHGYRAVPETLWESLAARREIEALLTLLDPSGGQTASRKITFRSHDGQSLDARLEVPPGPLRGTALFAHCFTCGKDSRAAVSISRRLAAEGIATLRFDFTGLGSSEGDFANSSFRTNVDDLLAASDHLRDVGQPPVLLIGHSLGGAAVLAAAGRIPECRGVATIGAPADPEHVTALFSENLAEIEQHGEAEITLAGRSFRIGKRFLDDLAEHCQPCEIAKLGRDLLILHAPQDAVVGIDNARRIYEAARHPKSFLSLDRADHLLTTPGAGDYAARIMAAWGSRLL